MASGPDLVPQGRGRDSAKLRNSGTELVPLDADPKPLVLAAACQRCQATADLLGSHCGHLTLCLSCGKAMALAGESCNTCQEKVTKLIKEYDVKAPNPSKKYYIGRFMHGLPEFGRKKSKWLLHREGIKPGPLPNSDKALDKFLATPMILEDDKTKYVYEGYFEGGQQASYTLFVMQGNDFLALPVTAQYNFRLRPQYKMLTLEEAEALQAGRKKTADVHKSWMLRSANTGAAAFGLEEEEKAKKGQKGSDDEVDRKGDSDGEGDRKPRVGGNQAKRRSRDEEGDEIEDADKGEDWEHDEEFTDDDEQVGNEADERPENEQPKSPPPVKVDEEEEEAGGGSALTQSGKELKKLLGKEAGEEEDESEDDDIDDDFDPDNDDSLKMPSIFVLKPDSDQKPPVKNETPPKQQGEKRKATPQPQAAPLKKVKAEPQAEKKAAEDKKAGMGPITQEEVEEVLRTCAPISPQEFSKRFKKRFKDDKEALQRFLNIVKKVAKRKVIDGQAMLLPKNAS